MSSQWLILLTFVSFIQLTVADSIDRPAIDPNIEEGIDENGESTPNIEINPIDIDPSYYYRLTNDYWGPTYALDVDNDGRTYALKMTPVSRSPSQLWRFIDLGDRAYSLRTRFLKDKYSLDIINDGINTKPHMAKTGPYSGQYWHLTHLSDGTCKLSNGFTGNDMVLDVYTGSRVAYMNNKNADYSGQHWTINKTVQVENR